MDDYKNLMVDIIEKEICVITFNRPKVLNVLNEETLNEFSDTLDKIGNDKKIKVLVLMSACEKAFTAGADIKEMAKMDRNGGKRFSELGQGIAKKLEKIPQPVIIGIDGYALGGGVEFACACDIRIATEKSKFSQPEIDIGVIPGWGGTQRLSRIIGIAKAKEMIYSGMRIDAQEAYEIGLVNHIVPAHKLKEAVLTLALTMASKGRKALFSAKKAINKLYESFIDEGLKFEVEEWTELFDTHDRREGMNAFLEGRHPKFKDK